MAAKKALKTSPTKPESRPPGRPLKIESPERLMQHFDDYTVEVKSKPFIVVDWVGGAGKQVEREKEKPLSLEGFNIYCYRKKIYSNIDEIFYNKVEYPAFISVCAVIRKIIREDQIAGGMAGVYNPSITQRLNGLVEKTENKNEVTEIKIIRAK